MRNELELNQLADAARKAREAFNQACLTESISPAEYYKLREDFVVAMKRHHEACGF